MTHHSPAEAARAYVRRQQTALSCITRSNVLLIDGYQQAIIHRIATPDPRVSLSGGFAVSLGEWVQIVRTRTRTFSVEVRGYRYTLYVSGRESLAYHWHPGTLRFPRPHLHGEGLTGLPSRLHLPTGMVAMADIVRFCIEELGTGPARVDWQDVLAEAAEGPAG